MASPLFLTVYVRGEHSFDENEACFPLFLTVYSYMYTWQLATVLVSNSVSNVGGNSPLFLKVYARGVLSFISNSACSPCDPCPPQSQ